MKTQTQILIEKSGIAGLSDREVLQSRLMHGRNELAPPRSQIATILIDLVREPMLILLIVASTIYFIAGNMGDGFFMISAIVIVTGISLYQESRSKKTLEKLRALTQPQCNVIRDRKLLTIAKEEVVVGDYIIIEEGRSLPADGTIIQSNDFSVNESILTGESLPVDKDAIINKDVYQGTLVVSGLAICQVNAIGLGTALGKIEKTLASISKEKTPLQKQIANFVKRMAIAGVAIFFIVWGFNFFQSFDALASLLKALTLAMSILPEEIPVAFTTFMALGAWRLMKLGVIIKNTSTVETLGSSTIICLDKTGTITENKMLLTKVYSHRTRTIIAADDQQGSEVITAAMWASEPIPFDAMEVALHDAYTKVSPVDERSNFKLIHEYPLGGKPPMMTHVFEGINGQRIVAAKGAPESLMHVSELHDDEKSAVLNALKLFTRQGYRVLGVGMCKFDADTFPLTQQEFSFLFLGLVAFYDPPKENITEVLKAFYNAGIQVKIITGDNAETTATIAKQINFSGYERSINGAELVDVSAGELKTRVMEYNIFTRMFPDAKLKIINALKANGQIVAMTGDGVNDGPALKAAHISIAMGKRGSEIAKEASSIVLTNDNLALMIDAIAMGRRIYTNLKKAIQYIISIHIPIILTVFIPLILRWEYPSIFTPVHVIFFELIMGPTCSIIYENEPMEANTMTLPPRPFKSTFFSIRELSISIVQGLAITIGTLSVYQYALRMYHDESITRTMVFVTLVAANISLTLTNRSSYYSVITTICYKNNLLPGIIGLTITLTVLFIYFTPVSAFFGFVSPGRHQLVTAFFIGIASVMWFEIVKFIYRSKLK